jgi:hypothetical protein
MYIKNGRKLQALLYFFTLAYMELTQKLALHGVLPSLLVESSPGGMICIVMGGPYRLPVISYCSVESAVS